MTKEYAEKLDRVIGIYMHDVAEAMAWGYRPALQVVMAELMDTQTAVRDWIRYPAALPVETWAAREDVVKKAARH